MTKPATPRETVAKAEQRLKLQRDAAWQDFNTNLAAYRAAVEAEALAALAQPPADDVVEAVADALWGAWYGAYAGSRPADDWEFIAQAVQLLAPLTARNATLTDALRAAVPDLAPWPEVHHVMWKLKAALQTGAPTTRALCRCNEKPGWHEHETGAPDD